jgi:predicted  nucleic acid-binding Zn ribbon protein
MYVTELIFECYRDTTITAVEQAIGPLIDSYYFNGQIIGREVPTVMKDGYFVTRVLCPHKDAVQPVNNSSIVDFYLSKLADSGLLQPKIQTQGMDINSDSSDNCKCPSWQVLYTTFIHTCSPLRCGEHFSPIALYTTPTIANGDFKTLLKWQQDWQACDQLQMNSATKAEFAALEEISGIGSDLTRRGRDICQKIESLGSIPTYYYLYRVAGTSLEAETNRHCPSCDNPWKLAAPLHNIFSFQCHDCRLMSNLSWDFQ